MKDEENCFEPIGDNHEPPFKGARLFKCKACGTILESGIMNLAGHWTKCAGKDFFNAVLEATGAQQRPFLIRKTHPYPHNMDVVNYNIEILVNHGRDLEKELLELLTKYSNNTQP